MKKYTKFIFAINKSVCGNSFCGTIFWFPKLFSAVHRPNCEKLFSKRIETSTRTQIRYYIAEPTTVPILAECSMEIPPTVFSPMIR